jgi:hypothetical protein
VTSKCRKKEPPGDTHDIEVARSASEITPGRLIRGCRDR